MKEDIIKMAQEAGCIPVRHPEYDNDVQVFATPDVIERKNKNEKGSEQDFQVFHILQKSALF